ncbi:hypothetical protein FQN57_000853 [Myotisia sp. PD_48]|nr:hypothetical protein FQN57_000853 [Myotisia sp. PD_48]
MLFKSRHPDVHPPTEVTVWQWLFESKTTSPLYNYPRDKLAGFTNAVTKERLDWFQVKECATYISTALVKKYGMKPEDTVALFSQNTIWYPVALYSTIRVGGTVAGASPAYNVEEMTYALKTAKAKFLMTSPSSLEVAIVAAKNAGIPRDHVFLLEGEVDGYTTLSQLQTIGRSYGEAGQASSYQIPTGKTNKEICGFLNFSSGTTGLPKAVMLSHHNVIAQCTQLQAITPPVGNRTLCALPLFHITGLVKFTNLPIFFNDELIMLPQFTMELMLRTIEEYRINELVLVPPIVIRLVNDPSVLNYDLSCVKRISCGAAPLSDQITQQLQLRFPGSGFKQGYGMTESCSCITQHSPKYYSYDYAHTVGDLVPSTEVKIIDTTTGEELDFDQPGEILARGPQVALGYLNNPTATADAFDSDGFLHTGDVGLMTREGLIKIVDRIKEMIKVKGIAVAPAELEDLLLGHDDVADCAVLGVADDYAGERPKAYVVMREGVPQSSETGQALMKYVRERKARFKWVEEIEFTDEIPKSASGKILRRLLRDKERTGPHGLIVKDNRERARM